MSNNENLKPFTKDNAKYYGRIGGINSGKVRAERRSLKEQLNMLLNMPIAKEHDFDKLRKLGFSDEELNNQLLLIYSLYEKALDGDTKAISLIFKTIQDEDNEKNNLFLDMLSVN